MTRRAYVYFVLTFLLGGVVGGAGLFSYAWYGGRWHQNLNPERVLKHLKTELALSDAQVQQLTPAVDDWVKKHNDLKRQVDPQFEALREEFRNRVRQVLDPQQLEKFNNLVRQHDEAARKRRSR